MARTTRVDITSSQAPVVTVQPRPSRGAQYQLQVSVPRDAQVEVFESTSGRDGSTSDTSSIGGTAPVVTTSGIPKLGLAPVSAPNVISARGHIPSDQSVNGVLKKTATAFFPLVHGSISEALAVFVNSHQGTLSGAPDVEAPNDLKIGCALVHSDGTVKPFTFGGQHLGTALRDGTPLIADAPVGFGSQVTSNDRTGAGGQPLGKTGVMVRTYVEVRADRADSITTTSGSPTILDASVTAADEGRLMVATGVPNSAGQGGSYAVNVVAGTSFQLAQTPSKVNPTLVNATASASVTGTFKDVIPSNLGPWASLDNVTADGGADLTLAGSAAVTGGTFSQGMFGPATLLGTIPTAAAATAKARILLGSLTDSIYDGLSDPTTSTYLGPVAKAAIALDVPLVKLSRGGLATQKFADSSTRRIIVRWAPGMTHAIIEVGTNDGTLNSAAGVLQLQDRLIAICLWLRSQGVKRIGIATVPPRLSATTDTYATTGGQTIASGSQVAQLAAINGWIRTPIAGLWDSVIDLADTLMSSTDSGLWKVNGTASYSTIDGVHPSAAFMDGVVKDQVIAWLQSELALAA